MLFKSVPLNSLAALNHLKAQMKSINIDVISVQLNYIFPLIT